MPKKSTTKKEVAEVNNVLSLTSLLKEDAQYTQKEIDVKGYKIVVDEKFRPTKVQELIKELLQKFEYMRENNLEMEVTEYVVILLIKYFTSVDVPETFEEQIQMFKLLLDHDYLESIINAFNVEEYKKLYETVAKMSENVEKFKDELLNNVDSPNHELIGNLQK